MLISALATAAILRRCALRRLGAWFKLDSGSEFWMWHPFSTSLSSVAPSPLDPACAASVTGPDSGLCLLETVLKFTDERFAG